MNIGVCYDVTHGVSCNLDPMIDLKYLQERQLLRQIHLTDGKPGKIDQHCALGQGITADFLPHVIEFAIEHGILCVLEVYKKDLKQSMRYLEEYR
jgi:sugar phosphate isomerase/epimerase